MDIWGTAIHESGHIMTAVKYYLPIEFVRITTEKGETKLKGTDIKAFREHCKEYTEYLDFGKRVDQDIIHRALNSDPSLNAMVDVYVSGAAAIGAVMKQKYSRKERRTLPRGLLSADFAFYLEGIDADLERILEVFDVKLSRMREEYASAFAHKRDSMPFPSPPTSLPYPMGLLGLDPVLLKKIETHQLGGWDPSRNKDHQIYKAVQAEFWERANKIKTFFSTGRPKALIIETARRLVEENVKSGMEIYSIVLEAHQQTTFKWNRLPYTP